MRKIRLIKGKNRLLSRRIIMVMIQTKTVWTWMIKMTHKRERKAKLMNRMLDFYCHCPNHV